MDDSTGCLFYAQIISYWLSIFVSVSYCWYWQRIAPQCVCQHYRISLTSRHPCYHLSIGHKQHPHQLSANMTPPALISHQISAVLGRNNYCQMILWLDNEFLPPTTAATPLYQTIYILIIITLYIIIRFYILWWQRWQVAKYCSLSWQRNGRGIMVRLCLIQMRRVGLMRFPVFHRLQLV